MRTLYVSDLDGTLLGENAVLSEFTRNTINELVDQGLLFTYATARSHKTASQVLEGLRCSAPAITHNGGFLTDPGTGMIYDVVTFEPEDVRRAEDVFRFHNAVPVVYSLFGEKKLPGFIPEKLSWYQGRETGGLNRFLKMHENDPRLNPVHSEEELFEGIPFYYNLIDSKEKLEEISRHFDDPSKYFYTLQQEIYSPCDYWLEIMPANATKAMGLKRLRKEFHFDRVVCFGDALNDVSMFQTADEAYAMENGAEILKKTAAAVIGSNLEDGVAKWLLENGQIVPGGTL
ncbi:HAD family hydrolase [Anaerolentibacter hominis]|uniref:HAD family hydrolase n=1 Tax=Anaerolentibacter hominis TaxID=3079009 RepID=UPI0031B7FC61